MKSFLSLPTVEQINAKKLLEQMQMLDAPLFLFKIASLETNISPLLAEKIYRELQNVLMGSGYGKVTVYLQNGVITDIEGERKHKIQEKIDLQEGIYVTSEFISVTEVKEVVEGKEK